MTHGRKTLHPDATPEGAEIVLRWRGALDLGRVASLAAELLEALDAAGAAPEGAVAVELSEAETMGLPALQALAAARREAGRRGVGFAVVAPPGGVAARAAARAGFDLST